MTSGSTSTRHGTRSGAAWIASEPPEVQRAFLDELSEGALLALPFLFEFWALAASAAARGDWKTWVILGGRGAGKTRAGAEWVRAEVEGARPLDAGRSRRVALVGETIEQAVTVMVEGESGILACSPPDRRPLWDATRKRLLWPNGAEARVYSAHDPERLRGPQFDAAWVDEYGCPAVDRGTNEPNKFVDPKSSESSLPKYSTGRRDDLIQMQYVRAVATHWSEEERNPVSPIYGARMIDMDHAYLWAWDARPYPWFPALTDIWSDGDNYRLGHWMTGRAALRSLASVVTEICGRAGVSAIDTRELYGIVRGYVPGDVGEARAMLQPLMLASGFDAAEREGAIVFRSRGLGRAAVLDPERFAVTSDLPGGKVLTRAAPEEITSRVLLTHVEAEGCFEARTTGAGGPGSTVRSVSRSELPLALTPDEAAEIAERWVSRHGSPGTDCGLPCLRGGSKPGRGTLSDWTARGSSGSMRSRRPAPGSLTRSGSSPASTARSSIRQRPSGWPPWLHPFPLRQYSSTCRCCRERRIRSPRMWRSAPIRGPGPPSIPPPMGRHMLSMPWWNAVRWRARRKRSFPRRGRGCGTAGPRFG
jgi:hypothetical protein